MMEKTVLMRTQGDGMEFKSSPEKCGYKFEDFSDLVSSEKKINLIPGSLIRLGQSNHNSFKKKEPKLVLYEPYKAAVKPIVPLIHKKNKNVTREKKIKNNLDCNELVSHILLMSNNELSLEKGIPITCIKPKSKPKDIYEDIIKSDVEPQKLTSEIDYLRNENATLKSQLAFQAQVNAELKTMLVAAVGEDVETRVHLLTEDKLHLAEALLKSVENLSTHQEQIEWLAGQCEVWRSKFLACSLMVQELANSKQILSQRVQDLSESLKSLLNEMNYVIDKQSFIMQNLFKLTNAKVNLPMLNILDVNDQCHELSKIALDKYVGNSKSIEMPNKLPKFSSTPAQAYAEKLLTNSLQVKGTEAICNAVVSTANSMSQ